MPTRPVILSRHFNYEGLYSSHYRYLIYIYVCICRNVRPTSEIIQDQTLVLEVCLTFQHQDQLRGDKIFEEIFKFLD
jgi:hypothetical protein